MTCFSLQAEGHVGLVRASCESSILQTSFVSMNINLLIYSNRFNLETINLETSSQSHHTNLTWILQFPFGTVFRIFENLCKHIISLGIILINGSKGLHICRFFFFFFAQWLSRTFSSILCLVSGQWWTKVLIFLVSLYSKGNFCP